MSVKITQPENSPAVPTEVIADAIVAIAEGVRKLRQGRLNDTALFLLIQHTCGTSFGRNRSSSKIPIKTIKAVFDGIDSLSAEYIRKPVAKR